MSFAFAVSPKCLQGQCTGSNSIGSQNHLEACWPYLDVRALTCRLDGLALDGLGRGLGRGLGCGLGLEHL